MERSDDCDVENVPALAMVKDANGPLNVPVDVLWTKVELLPTVSDVTTPIVPLLVMLMLVRVNADGRLNVPPLFVVMVPTVAAPVSVPPDATVVVNPLGTTYLPSRMTVMLSYVCDAVVTCVVLSPALLELSMMRSPFV